MKHFFVLVCLIWISVIANAQSVQQRLQKAWAVFEKDEQLKYAISSLYVIDAKTGEVLFDKNSRIGLAPASTQKVITSVTAFELLGKEYRYKTFFYRGEGGWLLVEGNGDPTFGSDRYSGTRPKEIMESVDVLHQQKKWEPFSALAFIDKEMKRSIPSGWVFEDIGNYYGAAPRLLNWKENQFDITFKPGKNEGDRTEIDTAGQANRTFLVNETRTGKKGSGDNAYVYFVPGLREWEIEGTVPAGEERFKISAADPRPSLSFLSWFMANASDRKFVKYSMSIKTVTPQELKKASYKTDTFYTHFSPSLDSIIYWFNKKSINLYGEALLNTFSYAKGGVYQTDSGLVVLKDFWKTKGFDLNELNLHDGSGLSPLNRVTTHAQVEVLKYARSKDWFPLFKDALPEYNGMTMKSGTITDVKGFCGYHTSKSGREYIFSFLVNNYNGKTSPVVMKMYRVLDELK